MQREERHDHEINIVAATYLLYQLSGSRYKINPAKSYSLSGTLALNLNQLLRQVGQVERNHQRIDAEVCALDAQVAGRVALEPDEQGISHDDRKHSF